MKFKEKYKKIQSLISDELYMINKNLLDFDCGNKKLQSSLNKLLSKKAKRLRPTLSFLYIKACGLNINSTHLELQSAIELIHNATLIHDDVIDCAEKRRSQKTINARFDNSLAVVTGDFLLSVALKKLLKINSMGILNIFAQAIEKMCYGEITQYFEKFKIPELQEYIEKCENKTAKLFIAAIKSIAVLEPKIDNDKAVNFAKNFGIAFQIRDDILNFGDKNQLKPALNDYKNGIYTAPLIYAKKIENIDFGIEKSKCLLDNYMEKAIKDLDNLKNNEYKDSLVELIEALKL